MMFSDVNGEGGGIKEAQPESTADSKIIAIIMDRMKHPISNPVRPLIVSPTPNKWRKKWWISTD
ncbi:MAG TPA: hypothetical protein VJP80_01060 [Candidatus Saccharimonadales bacterium]|nr:hypothetical protein [Candidatus Saccharimonadales bacterium]